MKKLKLSKFFDNRRFLILFSVFAAVFLYIVVAMTTNDTISHTIPNVPVNLELQSANLANLRLSVIDGAEYYVDVTVNGPRTIVGQLKADSPELATTARISEITEKGTHTVPVISALSNTSDLDFQITGYSPSTINVWLSRVRTSTFEIKPVVNGLSVAPGYVWDRQYTTQPTVNVSGPEEQLAQVASAEVTLELTEPLDQTYARTMPIVLRNVQGEEIDIEENHLSLDIAEAELVVVILKTATLPLEVGFTAPPRGFPLEELRESLTLDPDMVRVAGPADVVDRMSEFTVGYINLKELRPGNSSFSYALGTSDVSDQLVVLDNVSNVSAYFDDYDWETATFNIQSITTINAPVQYNVTVPSERIDGVQFVGSSSVLASMTADDIVAEIDLSDRTLLPGQYTYPVKISVPTKGLVWALGDHTVTIEVLAPE